MSNQNLDQQFNTIDFGSYSVWHQMVNRPRYWLAWQAMATLSDLMFRSNLLYRYMAYNAYNYLFFDYTLVQQGVLVGLST